MATENAIQVSQPSRVERAETFAPRSIGEAFQFADMVLMSGMAPKSYVDLIKDKGSEAARAAVVVALQFGLEVGFQPMQALQCIANINGNPSVWGDGALALVQSSGLMEWIKEEDLNAIKKNEKATCQVKRRGDPEVKTVTFTYQDAKDGKIFTRGVWLTYPHRMCMMRARAFALRDKFPDVLKGLKIAEEVMDYVDAEPQPEQPKIQATIVVPQQQAQAEKPAVVEQSKPTETQQADKAHEDDTEAPQEQPIDRGEAVAYFQAYSKSGWLKEESLAFLQTFDPPYASSLAIKRKDYEKAMEWANRPRQKTEEKTEENMDAEPLEEWTGELPQE